MGRRRDGRRLAEGADAAAGIGLQRGLRQGAGGREIGDADALILGLAGDGGDRPHRVFPLYAGHQPAVRAARGAENAARRRGLAGGFRPPHPPRRGDAARGRRLGARGAVRRSARIFQFADRGPGARRARRRPGARDHPRRLRHVIGHRARQAARQDLPHRPSRPFQRSDAVRHAVRGRDGAARRRHPAPRRRRRGRPRISRRLRRRKEVAMTPEQIDEAARALVAARAGPAIAMLPEAVRPQSEADSYAIQEAVLRRLGERVGGWKVGFSPEGGIFCAPIYASAVHPSPASLPAAGLHVIGIECEIGFRINQALAARALPYSRDEVLAAASLHPTIEVVDSRYQDFRSLDRLQVLADNYSNGGLVYGAAAAGWQGLDLVHPPIAVTADGKPFAECTGLRAGDPIGLLIDLVNHVANRRGGVPAGTFVTTGTHTGLAFTEPGTRIRADYGPLGRVEVAFPR